jgi:hypothetical protein
MPAGAAIPTADSQSSREPASGDAATTPSATPDDRERARQSPLFPLMSRPSVRLSSDSPASDRPATDEQSTDVLTVRPTAAQPRADGLFVPRL